VIVLAPHPGRVAHEVVVDLPYPRTDATRESEAFDALVNRTSRLLREAHKL
jgi:NitT/TauT family transport system ATP-binding protein